MITFSLQSGSNGNSIYVEAGDARLLFDAGISGEQAENRMKQHGRAIRDVQALIISHDHSDHTHCAGIYQRKFGLPIYMSKRVHRAVRNKIGPVRDVRHYTPGDSVRFGDVTVHTVLTPHDGIDTVCFVIEHERKRLAILTDLGCPFLGLQSLLADVDGAYLESNYDLEMLRTGPYSDHLKRRIAGDGGHLSNDESAELADRCTSRRLKWLAIAHLSQENNRSDLALETHRRRIGALFPVHLASRYHVSEVFEV
jgi:phosphoribosyl 1,2-cyclic phosphodiesterase